MLSCTGVFGTGLIVLYCWRCRLFLYLSAPFSTLKLFVLDIIKKRRNLASVLVRVMGASRNDNFRRAIQLGPSCRSQGRPGLTFCDA